MFKKIILLVLTALCLFGVALADTELEQIQKVIAEKGLHWTAGKTSVSDLSDEQKKSLCGLIIPPEVKARFDELNKLPPPPLSEFGKQTGWDWREHDGVTSVKDQNGCGSCWAFSAVAALESMVKIHTDHTDLDLSEQQILSCNTGGGSCNGGWMQYAYQVFRDYGAIAEWNMPYQASDAVPCSQDDWQSIVNIQGWTDVADDVDAIKNALATGPVAAAMSVFEDFLSYNGSCYVHATGDYVGEHAILIVGWDDAICGGQGGWIVKNSWGTDWGRDGFFLIPYGECDIGYAAQLIEYVPLFSEPTQYSTGEYPNSIFCADLDGDLDLDLAVSQQSTDSVSIFKNNGDGTFQPRVDYAVGAWPYSVFCADLDGDSDLDLAVADRNTSHISILRNNGDGTFQPRVNYYLGPDYIPVSVYCADLDGDTDFDLAVANEGADNVSILKNNGDGTFQSAVNYGVGIMPHSVFCADLDGDTDFDLAVANYWSDTVSILMNNGNGTFQPRVDYTTPSHPIGVFCADLDGDLDYDVAVANFYHNSVSVFRNNGNGVLQDRVDYEVGHNPNSVFCADLDGDSDFDLAVPDWGSNNVSILMNNGDGTFQPRVDYKTGDMAKAIFCADLDGDLDLDLAVANYGADSVCMLFNCGGGFHPPGIDLALDIWVPGKSRAGFNEEYTIRCLNARPSVANEVTLTLTLSPEVIYLSSEPPGNVSDTIITWNLGAITGGVRTVQVQVNVPEGVSQGTELASVAHISSTDPDEDLSNNRDSGTNLVVSSWDPNDKTAQPLRHFITGDEKLKYVIFFENVDTATAEAIDIAIEDTLDQNLDWSTLSIGPLSHPDKCSFSFNSSDGVISWFCDSIMLPPNVNPPEGEGFVSFSIKPDSGLVFGTQIKNRAYIRFDFNPWMAAPDSGPVIRTIGLYGDANSDGEVNVADVIYLVNYLFLDGPSPEPLGAGDANCDGAVNVADVIFLVNYLFLDGPPPGC